MADLREFYQWLESEGGTSVPYSEWTAKLNESPEKRREMYDFYNEEGLTSKTWEEFDSWATEQGKKGKTGGNGDKGVNPALTDARNGARPGDVIAKNADGTVAYSGRRVPEAVGRSIEAQAGGDKDAKRFENGERTLFFDMQADENRPDENGKVPVKGVDYMQRQFVVDKDEQKAARQLERAKVEAKANGDWVLPTWQTMRLDEVRKAERSADVADFTASIRQQIDADWEEVKKKSSKAYSEALRGASNPYSDDVIAVGMAESSQARVEDPVEFVGKTIAKARSTKEFGDLVLKQVGVEDNNAPAYTDETVALSEEDKSIINKHIEKETNAVIDELQNQLFDEYSRLNAPKNLMQYITSDAWRQSMVGSIEAAIADRISKNGVLRRQLLDKAYAQYGEGLDKQYGEYGGAGLRGVKGAVTMTMDAPVFTVLGAVTGGVGTAAVETAATKIATMGGRQIAKEAVRRYLWRNSMLAGVAQGMISSGLTFGAYDASKEAVREFGANELNALALMESAAKGFGTGAAVGALGGASAVMTDGLTGAAKVAGKVGGFGAEVGLFTGMQGAEEMLGGKDFADVSWLQLATENAAMIGTLKLTSMFNHMGEAERNDAMKLTDFNKKELAEAGFEFGNGMGLWSLADMAGKYKRGIANNDKAETGQAEAEWDEFMSKDRSMGETIRNKALAMFKDLNVSIDTKRKMLYYLTGEIAAPEPMFSYVIEDNGDGSATVKTYNIANMPINEVKIDGKEIGKVQKELDKEGTFNRYNAYANLMFNGDGYVSSAVDKAVEALKEEGIEYENDYVKFLVEEYRKGETWMSAEEKDIAERVMMLANDLAVDSSSKVFDGINRKVIEETDVDVLDLMKNKPASEWSDAERDALDKFNDKCAEHLRSKIRVEESWKEGEELGKKLAGAYTGEAKVDEEAESPHMLARQIESNRAKVDDDVAQMIDDFVASGERSMSAELANALVALEDADYSAAIGYYRDKVAEQTMLDNVGKSIDERVKDERERLAEYAVNNVLDGLDYIQPATYKDGETELSGFITGSSAEGMEVFVVDDGTGESKMMIAADDKNLNASEPVTLDEYMKGVEEQMRSEVEGQLQSDIEHNKNTVTDFVPGDVIQTTEGALRVAFVDGEGKVFVEPDAYEKDEMGNIVPKSASEYGQDNIKSAEELMAMQDEYYDGQEEVEVKAVEPFKVPDLTEVVGEEMPTADADGTGAGDAEGIAGAEVDAMADVPKDKNGEYIFDGVEQNKAVAYVDMIAKEIGESEASQYVEAQVKSASTQLDRINKKEPKFTDYGVKVNAYKEAKAEWQAQQKDAQEKVDYWKGVRQTRQDRILAEAQEAERVRKALGEARTLDELDKALGEAENLEEWVVRNMWRGKYLWSDDGVRRGLASEVFGTRGNLEEERRKRFGYVSDKDGKSLAEVAESLVDEARMLFGEEIDDRALRDIIINAHLVYSNRGEALRDIKRQREEYAQRMAEAEAEAQMEAANTEARAQGFDSYEEMSAYEDMLAESLVAMNDKQIEEYINKAIEEDGSRTQEEDRPASADNESDERVPEGADASGSAPVGSEEQENNTGASDAVQAEGQDAEPRGESGTAVVGREGIINKYSPRKSGKLSVEDVELEEIQNAIEGETTREGAEKVLKRALNASDKEIDDLLNFFGFEDKELTDEELLAKIAEAGNPDEADIDAVNEYDESYEDLYKDLYNQTADSYSERNISTDDAYDSLAELEKEWRDGAYATSDRTAVMAQMDAIRDYIYFKEKGDKSKKDNIDTSNDTAKPIENFIEGTKVYATGKYYEGNRREIAHGIKSGDVDAIHEAAVRMANIVKGEKDAVLVPIPNHNGKAENTLALAKEISSITGMPCADVLQGAKRETMYASKKANNPLSEEQLGITMKDGASIPDGKRVILVDNVIASGTTAKASIKAVGGADIVAFAEDIKKSASKNEEIADGVEEKNFNNIRTALEKKGRLSYSDAVREAIAMGYEPTKEDYEKERRGLENGFSSTLTYNNYMAYEYEDYIETGYTRKALITDKEAQDIWNRLRKNIREFDFSNKKYSVGDIVLFNGKEEVVREVCTDGRGHIYYHFEQRRNGDKIAREDGIEKKVGKERIARLSGFEWNVERTFTELGANDPEDAVVKDVLKNVEEFISKDILKGNKWRDKHGNSVNVLISAAKSTLELLDDYGIDTKDLKSRLEEAVQKRNGKVAEGSKKAVQGELFDKEEAQGKADKVAEKTEKAETPVEKVKSLIKEWEELTSGDMESKADYERGTALEKEIDGMLDSMTDEEFDEVYNYIQETESDYFVDDKADGRMAVKTGKRLREHEEKIKAVLTDMVADTKAYKNAMESGDKKKMAELAKTIEDKIAGSTHRIATRLLDAADATIKSAEKGSVEKKAATALKKIIDAVEKRFVEHLNGQLGEDFEGVRVEYDKSGFWLVADKNSPYKKAVDAMHNSSRWAYETDASHIGTATEIDPVDMGENRSVRNYYKDGIEEAMAEIEESRKEVEEMLKPEKKEGGVEREKEDAKWFKTKKNQKKRNYDISKKGHPKAFMLFKEGENYVAYNEEARYLADNLGLPLMEEEGFDCKVEFPKEGNENIKFLIRNGKMVAMHDELPKEKMNDAEELIARGGVFGYSITDTGRKQYRYYEENTTRIINKEMYDYAKEHGGKMMSEAEGKDKEDESNFNRLNSWFVQQHPHRELDDVISAVENSDNEVAKANLPKLKELKRLGDTSRERLKRLTSDGEAYKKGASEKAGERGGEEKAEKVEAEKPIEVATEEVLDVDGKPIAVRRDDGTGGGAPVKEGRESKASNLAAKVLEMSKGKGAVAKVVNAVLGKAEKAAGMWKKPHYEAMAKAVESKYGIASKVIGMNTSKKELVEFGLTEREAEAAMKMYKDATAMAMCMEESGKIVIFARGFASVDEAESTMFHENTHKHLRGVSEEERARFVDSVFETLKDVQKKLVAFIDEEYSDLSDVDKHEEFVAYVLEYCLAKGKYGMLDRLSDADKEVVNNILNAINYDRQKEGLDRRGRNDGNGAKSIWRQILWLPTRKKSDAPAEGRREEEGAEVEEYDPVKRAEEIVEAMNAARLREMTGEAGSVAEGNSDRLTEKMNGYYALDRSLSSLRKAMKLQKDFDKEGVKALTEYIKGFVKEGFVDKVSAYNLSKILSNITKAVGKDNIRKEVDSLTDMVVDMHMKRVDGEIEKLLKTKTVKLDDSHVQVMGKVGIKGQEQIRAFKEGRKLDSTALGERMNAVLDKITETTDDATREAYEHQYDGLKAASDYNEEMCQIDAELADLMAALQEVKDNRLSYTREEYQQAKDAITESIRDAYIDKIDAKVKLLAKLTTMVEEGIVEAMEFEQAKRDHASEVRHWANSDLKDIDDSEDREEGKKTALQKFFDNPIVNFFLTPEATLDTVLRYMGRNFPNGEGYLFNNIMGGFVKARDKEVTKFYEGIRELDAKASEVMGKKMKWTDLYKLENKLANIEVTYKTIVKGKMESVTRQLTQGKALYIVLAGKQLDGRIKLRKMGITDEMVDEIREQIDPKLLELGEWMRDEFLQKKRNEYNEVYKRMFGTSMPAVENYFPIRINKNALTREEDVNKDDVDYMPSNKTGSIIKRTRNAKPLDILNTDAFSVVMEHLQEMEHWAAFAEITTDANTLLSYKKFRNRVMNMVTPYGSGSELWNKLKDVVKISAGSYRPQGKKGVNKAMSNIAKAVTVSKIAFRPFTALKQKLSHPAAWSEASMLDVLKAELNLKGTWDWCYKNLPLFRYRVDSRALGDTRLIPQDTDWDIWKNDFVKQMNRVGMMPNAFIDAMTCAEIAKSAYDTNYRDLMKKGFSKEYADRKAKMLAEIAYNETQQSSEGMFVNPVQVDRDIASVVVSVFRNSSFAYTRKLTTAAINLERIIKNKEMMTAEKAKMYEREGLGEEAAKEAAEKDIKRALFKNSADMAIFGFVMQFLWNMAPSALYLIAGDDNEAKIKMIKEAALKGVFGGLEGFAGGNYLVNMIDALINAEDLDDALEKLANNDFPTLPAISDFETILGTFKYDALKGSMDLLSLMVSAGFGAQPKILTDAIAAVMDATNGDMPLAKELTIAAARVLQFPNASTERMFFDGLRDENGNVDVTKLKRFADRYVEYKKRKDTAFTDAIFEDEERDERYRKQFDKKLKKYLGDGNSGAAKVVKALGKKHSKYNEVMDSDDLADYIAMESEKSELYPTAVKGRTEAKRGEIAGVTEKEYCKQNEEAIKRYNGLTDVASAVNHALDQYEQGKKNKLEAREMVRKALRKAQ